MLNKHLLIRLCQARNLLRDTTACQPTIQAVARDVGISPYHFIRLFKAVFGETPRQVQITARLEKAKQLLSCSDYSVTRICMEVGYSSPGTFTDTFSRRIGITPSKYRQKARAMAAVPSRFPPNLVPGCFSLMSGIPG